VQIIRRVLLAIVAPLGLIAALGALASAAFGVGFGVVATGSMSPSIPAGALVVTVPTDATDLRIGDVVSVEREGFETTVTHRVVESAAVSGDLTARDLTLRGDANSIDDPNPYRVTYAARVEFSAPVIGGVVWSLRNPLALGIGTVLLTGLVLSAFWPSRGGTEEPEVLTVLPRIEVSR